jgi:hypothetical protein
MYSLTTGARLLFPVGSIAANEPAEGVPACSESDILKARTRRMMMNDTILKFPPHMYIPTDPSTLVGNKIYEIREGNATIGHICNANCYYAL